MKSTNGFVNRARNVLMCVLSSLDADARERERERRREREEEEEEEKAFVRSFVRSSLSALFTISVRHFFIQKTGKNAPLFPQQSIYKRDQRYKRPPARDNQHKRCSKAWPREVVRAHILARRRARPLHLLLPLPPPPKLNSSKPFREKEGSKNEEEEDVLSSSRKRAEATARSRKTAN